MLACMDEETPVETDLSVTPLSGTFVDHDGRPGALAPSSRELHPKEMQIRTLKRCIRWDETMVRVCVFGSQRGHEQVLLRLWVGCTSLEATRACSVLRR